VFDVVIAGGTVVDGTGAPGRRADVGVRDGRIAAIASPGELDGADVAQRIDATDRVVSPGFVDVHTHYDAQVFWDGTLSPSPLHGVTSVIAGNCGFSIAPLAPEHGDYMMRMLARVEGMPLEALREGVPWNWRTTAEYLDQIDGTLSINAGFMVGHSAIRRVVMGTDSVQREATPDELDQMLRLFHDGLDAGGLGFSSSWARTHNDADGRMVPSRYASEDELLAFCRATGEHEGTSLEFIPNVGPFSAVEHSLMARMSAAAQRHLNWNILVVMANNLDMSMEKLEAGTYAAEHGGKVVALTIPMPVGVRLSFGTGFVLDALPGDWPTAMALPMDQRIALLADPDARRRLDEQAQTPGPMQGLANWSNKAIVETFAPANQQYLGRTIGDIAAAEGREPFDVLCDIAVADELRTAFSPPPTGDDEADWKARVDVWRDGRAVIGASDAGAHLDLLATFMYVPVMLQRAVRELGLVSIEEAIHLVTDVQAQLYGLKERGRIAEGWHADLVVFDPATIASEPVATRFDLPRGAGRLYAEAVGIDHVLCNGVEIVRGGSFTDARPGTVLRSGRDTRTAF
jgi:N-acyl-D-aspartate/D-glutamate deacylase